MSKKREQSPIHSTSAEPQNTALAELLKAKGFTAAEEPEPAPPAKAAAASSGIPNFANAGKIVLRRERKGRGGKTVTQVCGLTLPPMQMEQLAKAMRKGLGCGSTVEGAIIVLQGDIVPRAADWLRAHGAVKLVIGN